MCRVISVSNQKGGVSKSTTVMNLGVGLAKEGKKILLIDGDPQGSLTASMGYPEPDEIRETLVGFNFFACSIILSEMSIPYP